jgi:PAS domain S-box-containing protein
MAHFRPRLPAPSMLSPESHHAPVRLFGATGELSELMEGRDWSSHPLGPPDHWPAALQMLVRSMHRSSGPMFVCWGPQCHLIYNSQYARVLCDKHPAAFGQPFQAVWPEVGPELDSMIARVLAGEGLRGENSPFRVRRHGRDQTAFFSFTWNPVFADDGQVLGFFCNAFETTAAVEAEQARADEASRLMQLFQQAPGFVAVLEGPRHVFRHANEAYLDFVGTRDVVGRQVDEVAPDAMAQGWGRVLDEVYCTGLPYFGHGAPVRLRRDLTGEAQELSVNFIFQPIRSSRGAVTGVLIQGYDVTAQARSQAALRESEAKFKAIADTIPQMVWTTRADGYHEYFNRQWYVFTGLPEGETDGAGWKQVLHPDDLQRTTEVWHHSLATGEAYQIEYRLRDRHGHYRWMLGRALPVHDAAGATVRWMGTCTEIDDHVKSRESLREDDRRKDEFLAMLAHELRNPLAPITSAVALLRRAPDDESRVRSMTEIIGRQADHMRGLVDDLLDVSRVTRGLIELQEERVDLRDALTEALEQTRPAIEGHRHAVVTRIGADELPVWGDRKRLVQVFANILGNAAKYTPAGGRITVGARQRAGEVLVMVEDNGQGMRAELIARVFELFAQGERTPDRREGGLGIGLALVRRLVELHGGRVAAFSEGPGCGSAFEVVLPAVAPTPIDHGSGVDGSSHALAPAATSSSVLIVDDNRDAADALSMFLQELGYTVRVENTAARALDAAREVVPDVCLLDIGLPDADGRVLAGQLRTLPGMAAAVMAAVSGYGQPEDVAITTAAGMTHFVKPIDAEALARWLQDATTAR